MKRVQNILKKLLKHFAELFLLDFAELLSAHYHKSSPARIYLFKVNNRNTRKIYEICSKLTINTLEQRHWQRSGVLLSTLNRFHTLFWCFHWWLRTSKCRLGVYKSSSPVVFLKKLFWQISQDTFQEPWTLYTILSLKVYPSINFESNSNFSAEMSKWFPFNSLNIFAALI